MRPSLCLSILILGLLGGATVPLTGCEAQHGNSEPSPVTQAPKLNPPPQDTAETQSGDGAIPQELMAVLPAKYEVVEGETGPAWAVGDLNGDGLADAAIFVRDRKDFDNRSAVIVAIGLAGGGYAFEDSTGNLGMEPLQYDVSEVVAIDEGSLFIAYQSMRWGIDLVFDWRKETQDLRLVSSETVNMGNADLDGAGTCRVNYVKGTKTCAHQHWDEEKGESVMETPKTESVSKVLHPLSAINDDLIYELQ